MEIFARRLLKRIRLAFDPRVVPQTAWFARTLITGTLLGLALSGTSYLILTYPLNRPFPAATLGSALTFIATITITVLISNSIRIRIENWKVQEYDRLGNALFIRYGAYITNRTTSDWLALVLPATRKNLLIAAGINPEDVFTDDTLNLTDEDLAILAALHGRPVPLPV